MDMTAEVHKDAGLDHKQIWNLAPEQIEMLCEPMGFEIETQMIEFFAGLGSEEKIMQIKRNSICFFEPQRRRSSQTI